MLDSFSRLPEEDWEELIRQSILQGTAGLLCHHLLRFGAGFLHESSEQACRAYVDGCEASFAVGVRELHCALAALAAAGVEAIPFKGPGLAARIYPKPALRRFRDLDLLIRPTQCEAAFAALSALGYRSTADVENLSPGRRRAYLHYNGQDIMFAPDRLPIEPHWALAPRTFSAVIDTEALFARAANFEAPGGSLRGFAPEDVLLAAALHGAKEQWARLVWVTDIAAICAAWPALDAGAVLERATACGCRRIVLLAILLAQELAGAKPPALLAERAQADPALPRLAAKIRHRLPLLRGESPSVYTLNAFSWCIRERLSDRLRYGVRTLLTARLPHFRAVALPDPLGFLYPAVRIGLDGLAWPLWRVWKRSQA